MAPIRAPPQVYTNPDAGVTATSPATIPDARPRAVGLPLKIHSTRHQLSPAAAAAAWVVANPVDPRSELFSPDPPLNPNHPNHSRAAPTRVSTMLFGCMACSGYPDRFRRTQTHASPANPAAMWTTVPPAKSRAPSLPSSPTADPPRPRASSSGSA